MRMYSWATWEGIGEALVAPNWLAWEGDASAVALAYSDALVLCRAQPRFSAIATLPLQVFFSVPLSTWGTTITQ